MEIQPNLKYKNNIIEQPYQFSVNSIFLPLTVRDKATISEYTKEMDHRMVLRNIKDNENNTELSLYREIRINKDNYDMYINGAALCVDTDLKIFWHLLNRKLVSDEINIVDLCKELEFKNPFDTKNHKTIIESFYRLSNNNIEIASSNTTYAFKLVTYKKEDDNIKYSFNEDFLTLMNSKNGLQRHSLTTLRSLKSSTSKLLYIMLVHNKYNLQGVRYFDFDELINTLGIVNKRKDKSKSTLKKALQELKDNKIIGDFNMKLNDVTIYNNHYINNNKNVIEDKKDVDNKVDIKENKKNSLAIGENGQFENKLNDDDVYW